MYNVASVEEIRSQFPALERRHNGYPVAYFDGPGGTQVPRAVGKAMTDYLYYHNANTHWAYPSSHETDELLAEARQALGDFLNASPDEIAFGNNMSTITFHLGRALGRQWQAGDKIVVTELDHHANIDPWKQLARDLKLKILQVRMVPETGQLDEEDLAQKLDQQPKLLALGAASNALGTVNDVARIVGSARSKGIITFVDAVHYAPHNLVDVQALGCDFLACSAYKFYGPHVGILYGRRANMVDVDFPRLIPAPQETPEHAETGTQNHEGLLGSAAAVDFLANLAGGDGSRRERLEKSYAELHRRGTDQVRRLWKGLAAIPEVTLYGPDPDTDRTSTLSFTLAGTNSEEVTRQLAELGVFTSHGDFYATTVVERLGLGADGLVRAGCACYTTDDEVERLIAGVRSLAEAAA